jgi:hypothetical protein
VEAVHHGGEREVKCAEPHSANRTEERNSI